MKRGKWLFICLIFIFYILPFFYLIQFVHFASDDLCRTGSNFGNYFEAVSSWYMNHNGRFFNALFALLPIYHLPVYRFVLALSMGAFVFIVFLFIKDSLKFFGYSFSLVKYCLFSLLFVILLFGQLPSLYEFFYWYAGTSVYLFSSIFFLLLLVFLYRIHLGRTKLYLPAAVLIVMVTGSTEMYIPLVNLMLLLFLVAFFLTKRKLYFKMLALNLISWVSSLGLVLSPGSRDRQSLFNESGHLFKSLFEASYTSATLIWGIVKDPLVWVFIGMVFLFLLAEGRKKEIVYYHPIAFLFFSGILFISVVYVPFYSLGFLDFSVGRIMDSIYFILYVLLLVNAINFFNLIRVKIKVVGSEVPRFSEIITVLFFLFAVTTTSKNYKDLLQDIKEGAFVNFENEMAQRFGMIADVKKSKVVLPEISGTRIIKHMDIGSESLDQFNKCYVLFINKKFNLNIQSVSTFKD